MIDYLLCVVIVLLAFNIAAHERRAGLTAGPILSYSLGLVAIALVVGFILLIGLSFAADYLQRLD